MSASPASSSPNRPPFTARLAGGRVAIASDGSRVVLAAAMPGASIGIVLFAPQVRAWAARAGPLLDLPAGASGDVTPVALRTPWLRGDDGEPALAIERTVQGPQARWQLLLRQCGHESAVPLADGDAPELLRRLASLDEATRDAG